MPWNARLLCLWPGLARLWLRGDGLSLVTAMLFAAFLNLALVASFVWPQYWGPQFSRLAWPLLAAAWGVAAWISHRNLTEWWGPRTIPAAGADTDHDTLFIRAQREYLRGNWVQARGLLEHRLKLRPRDAEARLLLVSVLRQAESWSEAQQALEALARLDEGAPWSFEIERERARITAGEEEAAAAELAEENTGSAPATATVVHQLHHSDPERLPAEGGPDKSASATHTQQPSQHRIRSAA